MKDRMGRAGRALLASLLLGATVSTVSAQSSVNAPPRLHGIREVGVSGETVINHPAIVSSGAFPDLPHDPRVGLGEGLAAYFLSDQSPRVE